jgi:hypothetical protein
VHLKVKYLDDECSGLHPALHWMNKVVDVQVVSPILKIKGS